MAPLLARARDAERARRGTPAALRARQRARLSDLVTFARTRSPLYRELYADLPADVTDVRRLPPVTKGRLMAGFDAWVTDPALTRAGLERFLADPSRIGRACLGRYVVGTGSGTTGELGIFVQDPDAQAVYRALSLTRGWLPWMPPRRLLAAIGRGDRVASVVATSGHYASVAMMELARRQRPWPFNRVRTFPLFLSTGELVRELNRYQPAELISYPSVLLILAEQQVAKRLAIRPLLVGSGAEWLSPEARRAIEAAFGCPVRENYGAAEFPGMAWGCPRAGLHFSADWGILEAVDEAYRPVPPGQPSATSLLTNLANRVQPLIRYELGDRITELPEPCPCGSALPLVAVEGRRDDVVRLGTRAGGVVALSPRTLATLVEETPGVRRYQLIQTGPARLEVRLEAVDAAGDGAAWVAVRERLLDCLAREGLDGIDVRRAAEPPGPDPVSGKYRKVWREPGAAPGWVAG